MKAGNREINIFNMSLLDVLCGALGAFCFLTLSLFPFYGRPDAAAEGVSKEVADQQKRELEQLRKELEQARSRGDSAAEAKALRKQVEQLQKQLASERKETQYYQNEYNRYSVRNPFSVQIWWTGRDHDVDLYILDPTIDEKLKRPRSEPPDPAKKQWPVWTGDVRTEGLAGSGSETWMMRDVPAGEYKAYYKLYSWKDSSGQSQVAGQYMTTSGAKLPVVTISPSNRLVFVGTFVMDQQRNLSFRPAPGVPPAPR
jgi:hypothetical protein